MGRACRRYNYFGRMLIFSRLHLPNQQCKPVFHLSNSFRVLASRDGKLCSKIRDNSGGQKVVFVCLPFHIVEQIHF